MWSIAWDLSGAGINHVLSPTDRSTAAWSLGLFASSGLGVEGALRGGRAGHATAGPAEHERDANRNRSACDRPGDVDPVVGELPPDEIRAERACRVHRRSRNGATP